MKTGGGVLRRRKFVGGRLVKSCAGASVGVEKGKEQVNEDASGGRR